MSARKPSGSVAHRRISLIGALAVLAGMCYTAAMGAPWAAPIVLGVMSAAYAMWRVAEVLEGILEHLRDHPEVTITNNGGLPEGRR